MGPMFRVENISKSFGPTKALVDVTLNIYPGEVRGLIGENGSGKSTLASIISGSQSADRGQMFFQGEPFSPVDSFEASEKGVTMIVQEQGTIDTISVAANIFAGRESLYTRFRILDENKLNADAQTLLERVGVSDISATSHTASLSFEERKMVEVARAFFKMPDIFIVDETTTALPTSEREQLYRLIREVKENNKSVIFISHDIDEMISVCDSVTILRDGHLVDTLKSEEMDPNRMKELMVGREIVDDYYRTDYGIKPESEKVLSFDNVSFGDIKNLNLDLHKGEILGICGLTDSGMHEVGKLAFGRLKPESGNILVKSEIKVQNPRSSIKMKIGYIPKDREKESLLNASSIKDNVTLPSLDLIQKRNIIRPSDEKKFADKYCTSMEVKMRNVEQACYELSGGNKQKVVLAKWIGCGSEIFIMDCPTRGIDIGVKESIYKWMEKLTREGKSILLISEELPEIIGMSDRIVVLKHAKIQKIFQRDPELKESDIIQYMI